MDLGCELWIEIKKSVNLDLGCELWNEIKNSIAVDFFLRFMKYVSAKFFIKVITVKVQKTVPILHCKQTFKDSILCQC